ncbi:hypothetical protein AB0D08_35915 [Kitasatospora sp. NPDC048540]|uniref:hypothetical protein n=1 Tax=unclassified Kitasatospora TaxID=2633591 RepID=UPI0005398E10|nr:hypothetical protein [Kitasatospora sp. MBT63]
MQYVDLDARLGELVGLIDPSRYLEVLPELNASLPAGAWAFAADQAHYEFTGRRCVKDLTIQQVTALEGGRDLVLHLRHNCWKHDEDLVIRYTGVTDVRVENPDGPSTWGALGTLILDEILPHDQGCTHEMAFRAGSAVVTCNDITATWVAADCPGTR